MIFVTVGLHSAGFGRLVRAADEMAFFVEETVVIQRGGTPYTPTSSQYFDFADEARMQTWLSEARIVIAHGGAGSILSTLEVGKPLIVAPRLKRFGEAIDDHQLELAQVLAEKGRAIVVTDLSAATLRQAVEKTTAQPTPLTREASATSKLQDVLRDWLVQQSAFPAPWSWRRLRRKH
jgi:beta-1,4-N-acetylglucosaminyltransferase